MKKLSTLLVTTVLLGGLTSQTIHADIETDTINEMWGKPTLVYGAGLNDSQVEETNQLFNIKNLDMVNRQVNSAQDFVTYLNQTGMSDSNLYSSVLVQKQSSGRGVRVNIKTPNNITSITQTQYANAAITAGATDVEIDVASPVKVTGESALVGVYKALSANGETIDPERAQAATQELSTVQTIAQENSNNDQFDPAALDLAIAQIKLELSKLNGQASEAQLEELINKALKDNGLESVITPEQVQSLINFASTYQNTSAIDSKEVAEQLQKYKDDTFKTLSDKFQNVLDNKESIMDKISQFFEAMFKIIGKVLSDALTNI